MIFQVYLTLSALSVAEPHEILRWEINSSAEAQRNFFYGVGVKMFITLKLTLLILYVQKILKNEHNSNAKVHIQVDILSYVCAIQFATWHQLYFQEFEKCVSRIKSEGGWDFHRLESRIQRDVGIQFWGILHCSSSNSGNNFSLWRKRKKSLEPLLCLPTAISSLSSPSLLMSSFLLIPYPLQSLLFIIVWVVCAVRQLKWRHEGGRKES